MKPAQSDKSAFDHKRLMRLDRHLREYVDTGKLGGINALIAHRNNIVYQKEIGLANDDLFRIYSLSKPITALAVMMLFEEGHYLLTDGIADYLPELKNLQVYVSGSKNAPVLEDLHRPLTIADLLCHTAGFGYGQDEQHPVDGLYRDCRLFRRDGTIADMVSRLSGLPLKFQPGTHWEYSISYDVLGRLVEVVSGISFADFLHTRIFLPLQMTDTFFEVPQDKIARLATMYRPSTSGGIELEDETEALTRFSEPVSFFAGGEGLVSTIPDYLRFLRLLRNHGELDGVRLLSRMSVALMTMNHLSEKLLAEMWLPGYGYGLGFGVLLDIAAAKNIGSVGEYGWAGSGTTFFWVDPVEDIISLLFAQFMPSSHYTIAREFKTLMYQALT